MTGKVMGQDEMQPTLKKKRQPLDSHNGLEMRWDEQHYVTGLLPQTRHAP